MRILARAFTAGGMYMHLKKIFMRLALLASSSCAIFSWLISILSYRTRAPNLSPSVQNQSYNKRIIIFFDTLTINMAN